MTSVLDAQLSLSAEEKFRAHFYLLLSRLLGAPADAELLGLMQELEGDDSAIGEAITDLKKLAANISVDQSAEEYEAIFIGVTQGELTPFKSYYLTGFLNENRWRNCASTWMSSALKNRKMPPNRKTISLFCAK